MAWPWAGHATANKTSLNSTKKAAGKRVADPLRLDVREIALNWSTWFRQIHRWLSVVFTVAVVVNLVALGQGASAVWVGLLALVPLVLLLLTGLSLFVLPYAIPWRSRRHVSG